MEIASTRSPLNVLTSRGSIRLLRTSLVKILRNVKPRQRTSLGHRLGKQCTSQMQNGTTWRTKKNCALSPTLSLTKKVIPWKTKMNQGGRLSGSIFQARVEDPKHHQYEDILRYVQKALDDIHWTVVRTEFDELKILHLVPMEFHMAPISVRGAWAFSSFSTL